MKFGVCRYNMGQYWPEVLDLKVFDTYEEAFNYYMEQFMAYNNYPYSFDKTLWYVWIDGGRITQFSQLYTNTKTKTMDVPVVCTDYTNKL